MIDGVRIKDLKAIHDTRGRLMEIFRVSETGINPKQVYMTTALEGVVKDKDRFHMHKNQNDNMCCVKGEVRLVIVDTREVSKTKNEVMEIDMGEKNPRIASIPKGVLHAFKSLKGESFIINCIDNEYDHKNPDEIRVENKYYDWDALKPIKRS